MVNVYHISLAFAVVANAMCLLVLLHDRRRLQNLVFFGVGTAINSLATFIYLAFLFPDDPALTTLFNRLSVASTALATSLTLCFALVFPTVRLPRPARVLPWLLAPAATVAVLAPSTDWFVVDMAVREVDGQLLMQRETGPLYLTLYGPLVVLAMIGAIGAFVRQFRGATTHIERKQLWYTAIAMGTGGVAATVTCIVLPELGHPEYYVLGPGLGMPLFILLMVYNIRTYRAMDIDELLLRSLLWALSLVVSMSPFALFVYVLLGYTEKFTVASGTAFLMLGLLVVVLYHRVVQPRIDARLRKKVYDYRKRLQDFHRHLYQLTNLGTLLGSVSRILQETLAPRHVSFLLPSVKRGEYAVVSDLESLDVERTLTLSPERARYIVEHAEILEREQLEVNPSYAPDVRDAGKRYLESFGAELSVPLVLEGRLIGAINLGPRATGYYSRVEIDFLEQLRGGINVALSNSMLLKDIENINRAYERFVPREMLSFLGVESIVDVALGDHTELEMSILFADIRAFTRLSEQMSPEENFQFINQYLHYIGPVVRRNGGFIDKYIGDGIMALFPGAPDEALRAAREMLEALEAFNAERVASGLQPVEIGIGVHTGMLMLGTIGESRRMEATVIADAVNLASRLEGLTKVYGVSVLASGDTLRALQEPTAHRFRHLGRVVVKGKRRAVDIFEVYGPEAASEAKEAARPSFEEGLSRYLEGEFAAAVESFRCARRLSPEDGAVLHYLKRAESYQEEGPPTAWDGAEAFDVK